MWLPRITSLSCLLVHLCFWVGVTRAVEISRAEFPTPKYSFMLRNEAAFFSSIPARNISVIPSVEPSPEGDLPLASDIHFGQVIDCSEKDGVYFRIPGLEFGGGGGFAVAFWMKLDQAGAGQGFDYLLSIQGQGSNSQVSLLVPEMKHPDHGVLRGVVKDDEDASKIDVYLDSTGCVSQADCALGVQPLDIGDGNWHYVTLTTHSKKEGEKGFQMYIDGGLVGDMKDGEQYVTATSQHSATGGGPMDFDGSDLYICARSSDDAADVMTGSIVDLLIFDQGLSEEQVKVLYEDHNPFEVVPPGLCSVQPVNGTRTNTCEKSHSCYVLSATDFVEFTQSHEYDNLIGRAGLCVPDTVTDLLPDPLVVPPAMAFFPMIMNRVESYPLPLYGGDFRGASLMEDGFFGRSLYCNGSEDEYVALDPVAYGIAGQFSINLWIQPANVSEKGFSWVFSHGGTSPETLQELNTSFGKNQVQIFLTENGDGAAHVSAFVRDDNDEYTGVQSESVLHSDGSVGLLEEGRVNPNAINVLDGKWHMVTLTSRPEKGQGYVLFVDGVQVNELNRTVANPSAGEEEFFEAAGGEPMHLTGDIVLCAKGSGPAYHYHGKIAFLSVWEQSLVDQQVKMLYDSVVESSENMSEARLPAERMEYSFLKPVESIPLRFSMTGKKCVFPTLYNNENTNDCVDMNGILQCNVGDNTWEPCIVEITANSRENIEQRDSPGVRWNYCSLDVEKYSENSGCADGLSCIPGSLEFMPLGSENITDIGVCDVTPSGFKDGFFEAMYSLGATQPDIFYPLTGSSLEAVTQPNYDAIALNIQWVADSEFESVPFCDASRDAGIYLPFVLLDQVNAFAWTLNLWIQREPSETQPRRQTIMSSQRNILGKTFTFSLSLEEQAPDEARIYFELVDSDGEAINSWSMPEATIRDDDWHMITVTNDLSDSGTEISIYLDGERESTISMPEPEVDSSPGANITLCSLPGDLSQDRRQYFNGKVTNMMMFAEHLHDENVEAMYKSYRRILGSEEDSVIVPNLTEGDSSETSSSGLSPGAIAGIVIGSILGALLIGILVFGASKYASRKRATSFRKFDDDNTPTQEIESHPSGPAPLTTPDKSFSYTYPEVVEALSVPQTPASPYSRNGNLTASVHGTGSFGSLSSGEEIQLSVRTEASMNPSNV